MNRRNFLSLAALAIAGKAAERVFPFRVYSIPKEIVVADPPALFGGRQELPTGRTATEAVLEYQNAVYREMMMRGFAVSIGDTIELYNGPGDVLRGIAKVQRIHDGKIILDHVPAGCVPGDTIIRRPTGDDLIRRYLSS